MPTYPWENMRPNDTFQLVQREWISDRDWEQLLTLYLPIIGSEAYTLFHAFYQQINKETFQSEVMRHSAIMNRLVWGKETYLRSRMRLEALGLIKVYTRKEQFQDPQLLVMLYAPVTRQAFFADPTLSSLLYSAVGEGEYQKLADKDRLLLLDKLQEDDWQETTAQLKDVYRLPMQHPNYHSASVSRLQDAKETAILPLSGSDFDQKFFVEYLQQSFLGEKAVTDEVLAMSKTLYQLYGISEMDLARLAYQAADVGTNTIDVHRYQMLALKQATSNQAGPVLTERVSVVKQQNKTQQKQQQAHWQQQGLTQDQLTLAAWARSYAVIPFARYLKESRNGFLTRQETRVLSDMMQSGRLKPEVINIMVYFYLIEQERESLPPSTLQRTEDDWLQHQVDSAEAALVYLKQRQEKQKQKKETKRYQKPKQGYQESVPQWLIDQNKARQQKKDKETPSTTKAAPATNQNDLKRRLEELMKKGGK
ncbi:MAG: hypothetical protein Q4A67_06385 [Aerococcus sp.]|nr:hypothetical protein [Aerococcus sp.]